MTHLRLSAQQMRAVKQALRFTVLAMEKYPTEYQAEAIDALNSALHEIRKQDKTYEEDVSARTAAARARQRVDGRFVPEDPDESSDEFVAELQALAAEEAP